MNEVSASVSPVRVSQGVSSCLPRRGFSLDAVRNLLRNCFASLHAPRRRGKHTQRAGVAYSAESPEARLVLSGVDAVASMTGSVTFDFGTDQSPVDPDALQVSNTIRYSDARGFGMTSAVRGIDRGRDDDLLRDFVEGSTVGFRVDLPDGIYEVEPVLGDRLQLRDRMQVSINGKVRGLITTLGGTSATPSYYVEVQEGQIDIEVTDLGGDSPTAALAALTITAMDSSAGIPEDNPAPALNHSPLVVVMTHGRVTPPEKDGGLLGTVVSKLAGNAVNVAIAGEEGKILGGIAEGAVKSAFPSEGRPDVSAWVRELPRAMAQATRREGLGTLNPNVRPIPLPKIEKAASDEDLLNLLKGSQDFIATNWSTESSFGTPQTAKDIRNDPWDVYNEREHRQAVIRTAIATFRMLEARIRQEIGRNPQAKVDLLIVGHSFGATVNREVILLLNKSPLADHIDFVKVVELDPVAMKPDPKQAERAESHDRYFWNSPAAARNGKPIVDSIVNYYQTEGLAFTGVLEKGLITGLPLDGRDGGGLLGFRNGRAMVFGTETGDTLDQIQLVNDQTGKSSNGDLRNGVYSDDGRWMALASEDGTVSLRNAATHQQVRRLVISKAVVTDVQFLPGSDELVTVSKDGRIRIFRVDDGALVWTGRHLASSQVKAPTLEDPDGTQVYRGAKFVAVSSDGRMLATAGTAEKIRLWRRTPDSSTSFELTQTIPGHKGGTMSLAFAADGTLITGGNDGELRVWKPGTEFYVQKQVIDLNTPIRKVQFSGDFRFLATASGKSVSMWMFGANGNLIRTQEFRDHVADTHALAFTADGSRLATGGKDRTIFIYDTSSGKKVNVLNQAMLDIRNLAFSRDGRRLLATYFDLEGGPVRDINVTDQVRSRVGLFENLFAGGSKHHSAVPFVYIDLVIRKTNDAFFEMRDKPRASRYGDFTPGELTRSEDDTTVSENAPDAAEESGTDVLENPWLENWHAPEIVRTIPEISVTDSLSISLSGLAQDVDGNELQWTVRSSNTNILLATIDGKSLLLRPLKEGRSEIELTANDGRWAAQIRFVATADGSAWRAKSAALRKAASDIATRLQKLDPQVDALEDTLVKDSATGKALNERDIRLQNQITDLQEQVASTGTQVDRLRQTRTRLLTTRNAAESVLDDAEAKLQAARETHEAIDVTTRQLFRIHDQRQDQKTQARIRLENATKSNRAARKADFDQACDAAEIAESNWRAAQARRDKAEDVLENCKTQRNKLASQLSQQNRLLADTNEDLNRVQKSLADTSARLQDRLSDRRELLAHLNTLDQRLQSMQSRVKTLNEERKGLAVQLGTLRERIVEFKQTKWVTHIGLDKIDDNILDPAVAQSRQLNLRMETLLLRISRVQDKIEN